MPRISKWKASHAACAAEALAARAELVAEIERLRGAAPRQALEAARLARRDRSASAAPWLRGARKSDA